SQRCLSICGERGISTALCTPVYPEMDNVPVHLAAGCITRRNQKRPGKTAQERRKRKPRNPHGCCDWQRTILSLIKAAPVDAPAVSFTAEFIKADSTVMKNT
ncbi:hypothetical protein CLAIMM_10432, partial [Cladophialophora immunda]